MYQPRKNSLLEAPRVAWITRKEIDWSSVSSVQAPSRNAVRSYDEECEKERRQRGLFVTVLYLRLRCRLNIERERQEIDVERLENVRGERVFAFIT